MLEQAVQWLDEQPDSNNVVGTITINKQPCACMIQHVVCEWWNNKIDQQRCVQQLWTWLLYNTCIKSDFACSNICEQPLSIHQAAVYNMLKYDWTILSYIFWPILLYHVNSVVRQGCLTNCNSLWYFLRVIHDEIMYNWVMNVACKIISSLNCQYFYNEKTSAFSPLQKLLK